MDPTIKKFLLHAITQSQGDDYNRAKRAFSRCTPEEMKEEYGESGRSRQEILDAYKAHDELAQEARQWVEEQE